MNISDQIKNEISTCISILKSGGVILYPTDTVWGIGCDATNESAVQKIYTLKKREESKSMIVLIDVAEKLNKYVKQVPAQAWDMVEYSEKPLTIVYPAGIGLAKNLFADDGTVAIRVVKNDFCKQLIYRFGRPLVSTSANITGNDTPLMFSDIDPYILSQVDYVVNLPEEKIKKGTPSTILKMELNGGIKFLRK